MKCAGMLPSDSRTFDPSLSHHSLAYKFRHYVLRDEVVSGTRLEQVTANTKLGEKIIKINNEL